MKNKTKKNKFIKKDKNNKKDKSNYNKIKYSLYLYDLLTKCFKKIDNNFEKIDKKDKDFIYNNLFDFFI